MQEQRILPISVLIPTMNRVNALQRTLESYLSADSLPGEIVVVDQSEDAAMEQLITKISANHSSVAIEYFHQDMPSLTKARNNAVRLAKNEIIVFSDDDVDVYNDTLDNVYDIMSSSDISMLAATNDEECGKSSPVGFFVGTRSFVNRNIGHVTKAMLGRYPDIVKGTVPTRWAMGYFFAVKKSLIDRWQLEWDENLSSYAYAEDLDFSFSYYKKSKSEGLKCILDERVHVKHLASKEYRVPSKKSTYMYVLNRAYLSYKHKMGVSSYLAMSWCDFFKTVERFLRKENPKDIINARKYFIKHKSEIKNGKLNYDF